MDANLMRLRAGVVDVVNELRQSAKPRDIHADYAEAVLVAALWRLEFELPDADTPVGSVPDDAGTDEVESRDAPRSLADYRRERGMSVLEFGECLGIAHFEYQAVAHRRPVDRRLRDQIALKLGVDWRVIAEFVPEQPQERPQPDALI